MPEVHSVAQRQGAVVPRAVSLPSGGRALAKLTGEVLGVDVRTIPVGEHESPVVDGIANRAVLLENRAAQRAALGTRSKVLTIGGDCGVELEPVRAARERYGRTLALAWFDAHGDLHTPATSPSHAFHGMVLRAAMGDGDPEFTAFPRIGRGRTVLLGARALDPAEREPVWRQTVRHLPVHAARRSTMAGNAVLETDADEVYLHVDLDVLDPAEFDGVGCPAPGGLTVAELVGSIRAIAAATPVIGAGITECATDDPAALGVLIPLLEAVGSCLGFGS
ncbi:arginase family protein [Umezawaea endophytica]|uniref:Arginase family protein n=1 Tax=Umezawaea endophytica TaxID=1654476 RepID=A0A9X3A3I7_9PSEU|nr:arginase family protein [Umezawaea endophytica]MCS7480223.1 arginase family protein [Umezawaea endophytica]